MLTRYPLRKSLPLLLGCFALVFTLMLITMQLPRSLEQALQTWREHSGQMLILVQGSLADHLRKGRNEEMETQLADLSSIPGVSWAMVVDEHLQTLAATRLDLNPKQLAVANNETLQSYIATASNQWLGRGTQQFVALYPLGSIAEHGQVSLLVNLDFTPLLGQIERNSWLLLGETLTLLLVLGLLLNYLYRRLITQRLARLESAARHFSSGEPVLDVPLDGHDEIGNLASTFNTMMHQLHNRQRALSESEALLRDLINSAPVGMLVVDQELRVEQANPAAAALFGCRPEELIGNIPEDRLVERNARQRLQLTPANIPLQLTAQRGDSQIPLEVTYTPFQRNGKTQLLVLLYDISERIKAEQRLRFLAHFDPLTNLANRHYLLQRLEQVINADCPLSLLFLDLDHFKRINDTLGHELGDHLLVELSRRLQAQMPGHSLLARSGGDEFVLLLEGADLRTAQQFAGQLQGSFSDSIRIHNYDCHITTSIGITTFTPGSKRDASELLKQADLALYMAKDQGRNRIAVFNSELSAIAEQRRQLENDLRRALLQKEFVLYYQPQVDNQGQIQAMEALLRWHSPLRGVVAPSEFIPILEETGLIIETTHWVFRQACRQARLWAEAGQSLRVAVNLSPLDFRQADLAGSLLAILDEEGVAADLLELEITEGALLDADDEVLQCLQRLRDAGLPLLLDDFGTGFSSLTHLLSFPFDGIKIDRQFVAGLPSNEQAAALVRGILTMASQLNLLVVAEGVENEQQAAFLRLNGCASLQGFLYARPQPAELCTIHTQPGYLLKLPPNK